MSERIYYYTTHVGSLPQTAALLDLMRKRAAGRNETEAARSERRHRPWLESSRLGDFF